MKKCLFHKWVYYSPHKFIEEYNERECKICKLKQKRIDSSSPWLLYKWVEFR